MRFSPFTNEADVVSLAELTIENRVDRVTLFGSIDFTRDKTGLANALVLKDIMNTIVNALESEVLTEHVNTLPSTTVEIPFNLPIPK